MILINPFHTGLSGTCTGSANQKFVFKPSGVTVNYTFAIQQGNLCVDQQM